MLDFNRLPYSCAHSKTSSTGVKEEEEDDEEVLLLFLLPSTIAFKTSSHFAPSSSKTNDTNFALCLFDEKIFVGKRDAPTSSSSTPESPRGTRVGCTSVSLYTSPRVLGSTTRAKRFRRATGPSIERILYSFFSLCFRSTSPSALLSLERRLPISSSSRPSLAATSRNRRDQSSSQMIQRR